MDPDLDALIRSSLAEAEADGKDYLSQTEKAVRAVRRARPDMTAPDALNMVHLVRRQWDEEGADVRIPAGSKLARFLDENDPSAE